MSDFKQKDRETLSRQHAAERLIDIAYALSSAPPLELRIDGEQMSAPISDELLLERRLRSTGGRVELELDLSWARPPGDPTA